MSYNLGKKYIDKKYKDLYSSYTKLLKKDYEEEYLKAFLEEYIYLRYEYKNSLIKKNFSLENKLDKSLKEKKEKILLDLGFSIEVLKDKNVLENLEYIKVDEAYVLIDELIKIDEYVNKIVLNVLKEIKEEKSLSKTDIKNKIEKNIKQEKLDIDEKFLKDEDLISKIKEQINEDINILSSVYNIDSFILENKILKEKEESKIEILNLKHNIDFPYVYSDEAIKKVQSEGIVYENMNILLYYMASHLVILDVLNFKLNNEYIVRFPEDILDKKQKRKSLINILSKDIVKERVIMYINYSAYVKYEKYVLELIKEGFLIEIRMDEYTELSYKMVKKLELFRGIIINIKDKNLIKYIKENKLDEEEKEKIEEITNKKDIDKIKKIEGKFIGKDRLQETKETLQKKLEENILSFGFDEENILVLNEIYIEE